MNSEIKNIKIYCNIGYCGWSKYMYFIQYIYCIVLFFFVIVLFLVQELVNGDNFSEYIGSCNFCIGIWFVYNQWMIFVMSIGKYDYVVVIIKEVKWIGCVDSFQGNFSFIFFIEGSYYLQYFISLSCVFLEFFEVSIVFG